MGYLSRSLSWMGLPLVLLGACGEKESATAGSPDDPVGSAGASGAGAGGSGATGGGAGVSGKGGAGSGGAAGAGAKGGAAGAGGAGGKGGGAAGASGASGTGGAGASGASGASGSAGTSGASGASGVAGASGAAGSAGSGGSGPKLCSQLFDVGGLIMENAFDEVTTTGIGIDQGSCGGGKDPGGLSLNNAPEHYYAFTPDFPTVITFRLTTMGDPLTQTNANDPTFNGVMYLRTKCGDPKSEIACTASATTKGTTLSAKVEKFADLFLVVDGYGGDIGTYRLYIETKPWCKSSADCASSADGKVCDVDKGLCVGCATDFDCPSSAPVCVTDAGKKKCVSYDTCVGDDAAEPGDDGPSGATDATPTGAAPLVLSKKICSVEGETDWFKVTAASGDAFTFDLAWADASVPLSLELLDAKGRLLGESGHQKSVKLTYLPAGTVYARVTNLADPGTQVVDYTLTVTRSGTQKCATSADCAAEFGHQRFRALCDAPSGECRFVDGKGALPAGASCDHDADCATKACSYYPYTAAADARSTCTAPCSDDTACGTGVCSLATNPGRCIAKCTASLQCPVEPAKTPSSGDWVHLTCGGDGKCTP